jgi:uncharacterized membrane protein YhaH (DUF805 family)
MTTAATTTPGSGLGTFFLVLFLFYAAIAVVGITAWVKILGKAGYSGWWVLIALVPIANVVMFLVFAFSEWPVVRAVRSQSAGYGGPGVVPARYR